MRVRALDPKFTHKNNPDCPMRLAPDPDGCTWYCLDCGFAIVVTSVDVKPQAINGEPCERTGIEGRDSGSPTSSA